MLIVVITLYVMRKINFYRCIRASKTALRMGLGLYYKFIMFYVVLSSGCENVSFSFYTKLIGS